MLQSVLAIDPGLRNISCCYSDREGKIVEWFTETMLPATVKNANKVSLVDLTRYTQQWHRKRAYLFAQADVILVEHQMKDRFILLEGILLGLGGSAARPLSPYAYKRALGLCQGTWAKNKKAVVSWCRENENVLGSMSGPKGQKLDDLADSRAMVYYWLKYKT